MKLSVVSTMFRSAEHLVEFHRRVTAAAAAITDDYELILVNDGSPDHSQTVAEDLALHDPHVAVIELSRNFGHHKAILAGLEHASGERVFLLDCDLEEDPAWLSRFWTELDKGDDVIFGVQETRKGGAFERVSGGSFWKIFNWVSEQKLEPNLLTIRLMTRAYVRALVAHGDQEVFLGGLFALAGFRQRAIPCAKGSRGESTYSLRKKLSLLVNAITSFSSAPLVFIFYLGTAVSSLAGLVGVYLLGRKVIFGDIVDGFVSVIVSIWFLGGLILFAVGVTGIYLSKIFNEVKRRPRTVIRSYHGRKLEP